MSFNGSGRDGGKRPHGSQSRDTKTKMHRTSSGKVEINNEEDSPRLRKLTECFQKQRDLQKASDDVGSVKTLGSSSSSGTRTNGSVSILELTMSAGRCIRNNQDSKNNK